MPVLNQLKKQVYHRLHYTLLYQLKRREKQLRMMMMQDPVITPMVLQPKIWNRE
jgi:hypothetical protein